MSLNNENFKIPGKSSEKQKSFNANASLDFSVTNVSDGRSPSILKKSKSVAKYSGFSVRTKHMGVFKERV